MAKAARSASRSGDMNVYTALLFVAALVLGTGVALISISNMTQAEAGGNPGSPLTLVR